MGSRIRDTVRFLFELFCEISPGNQLREPYITKKYPENYKNEEELKNIPKFTFPCELEMLHIQKYSFVLTSGDSKYTFGFCRYDPQSNTALVLLSHLPWHDIFYKLLQCIADIISGPNSSELISFLEACHIRPPMPGHTLKINNSKGNISFVCQCPDGKLPQIPENTNLTEYFSAVDSKCMMGVWAALLHERRVAIVAKKPSRLSACVQAANATLYPMSWQHIFIPILPKHLVDYLTCPMPFLIGVPKSIMESVRMSEVGDIVILDADTKELRTPFHDLESLPHDLVSSLKKALNVPDTLGEVVPRAFLRALVCLIGGYRDVLRIERGHLITFNEEAFVRMSKNRQPFLEKILQSQIFRQFIDERLDLLNSGTALSDEFELECHIYADKLNTGSGQKLKQQYKEWAKNVKKEGGAFFKTVKDKANPAMQSAVKTVRQGGRNVKSAVRGLKKKIPRTGSRPSSINTTDDSRFSCGSATPVSSNSSSSSPSNEGRDPPPALPLDLLTEMDFLFHNTNQRRDSLPNNLLPSDMKVPDKSKTLSPGIPPRPQLPARYPIISTRKLVDISDAPTPPPRTNHINHANNSHFVSNIIKNENPNTEFARSTIIFTEGKDKAKLKLTMSNQRKGSVDKSQTGCNGTKSGITIPERPRPVRQLAPTRTTTSNKIQESCSSVTDLIKLDDSPTNLADFDPIKCRKTDTDTAKSTDSALLSEYGLDFSQFGFFDHHNNQPKPNQEQKTNASKGWTTFD